MFESIRDLVISWAAAGYLPENFTYHFVVNAMIAGAMLLPLLGGFGVSALPFSPKLLGMLL